MPIPDDDDNGPIDHQVELLTDVELVSFTATPTALGPFGVSLLKWNVRGVKPGVRVLLTNLQVPVVSERAVRPLSTQSYHLAAASGPARKPLGTRVVHVDLSSCTEVEIPRAFELMRNLLFNAINNEATTYWSGAGSDRLAVTETDGRIHFKMVFRKRIGGPDLWIRLHGTFGLRIEDGRLVSVGEVISGDAAFPKWWGFLTGFLGGLALAVNEADAKARQQARDFVQVLVDLLNLLLIPSEGKSPRTVHVTRSNDQPIITYSECDNGELLLFAQTLESSVLRARDPTGEPVAGQSRGTNHDDVG